jgi:hypothetical protein
MNESEDLGRTFLRDALSSDDLEASVGSGQALASSDVASVQPYRDRGGRLWRRLDLALGA